MNGEISLKYKVKNINKSFGNLKVLDNISISFPENKTTCILGPSGCGKTTLLNIIAGLLDADSGELIGFENKDISFVFQEDRLIPWKNVEDNLAFVLKKNTDKREVDKLINHYLELVGLEKYKHYHPKEVRGGMQQRINILRAVISESKI